MSKKKFLDPNLKFKSKSVEEKIQLINYTGKMLSRIKKNL